ncbi:polysaccharide biosynthesis C-terminal domain-containing protein [Paenibacillus sp. P26]|nr:polysaccharide biosynthesis C-terminal domain-containing protein [Paenibacillus sp. P26]
MISAVAGEGAGLLYLLLTLQLHKRRSRIGPALSPRPQQEKRTLGEPLKIGSPTTGNGFIHSIYRAAQPMLILKSLAIAGISTAVANKQFGLLAGYTFPLLAFPTFIMHSLSTALVPAISEAGAHHNRHLVHQRLDQAIRFALIIGAPCTVILYTWAVPLATAVYHSPEAGGFLKPLAPIFLLHYFEPPLHAVLLGLGRVNTVMRNFIASTLIEASAIFVFGSQLGIHGVIWGMSFGIVLIALLNFLSVSRVIGFSLDIRSWIKVGFCCAAMMIFGQSTFVFMSHAGFPLLWTVAGSIAAAWFTYVVSLISTNAVKRHDIQRIPLLRKVFP